MGYDLSRLVGCVITHEHKDHSRYVGDVLKAGVRTLALPSVFENIKNTVFAKTIEDGKGYMLGRFKIAPFTVRHDVPCVGYLISHPEIGRLLGLSKDRIRHLVSDGEIPYYKPKGRLFFKKSEIEGWMLSNRIAPDNSTKRLQSHQVC